MTGNYEEIWLQGDGADYEDIKTDGCQVIFKLLPISEVQFPARDFYTIQSFLQSYMPL